jgi:hypothetical protein
MSFEPFSHSKQHTHLHEAVFKIRLGEVPPPLDIVYVPQGTLQPHGPGPRVLRLTGQRQLRGRESPILHKDDVQGGMI